MAVYQYHHNDKGRNYATRWRFGNDGLSSNFLLKAYDRGDLNLDGKTIFAGPDNDINMLLGNVLLLPNNNIFAANYIISGGM